MNDGKASNRGTGPEPQPKPETTPTAPNASMPNQGAGWASAPTSQVIRTVAVALLTTVVVLVAIFLLWQVRTFIGWLVIALFLAAVLNPAVNWLQRRHRLMKRPLAIGLTYLGVLVALLFVAGDFVALLGGPIKRFLKVVS